MLFYSVEVEKYSIGAATLMVRGVREACVESLNHAHRSFSLPSQRHTNGAKSPRMAWAEHRVIGGESLTSKSRK